MFNLKMFRFSIVFMCFLMGSTCSPNPSIIIVGTGASGIAAATKLLKNNFTNIKILEADDRIGGRINSVKFGDAYVDLGAEYCCAENGNIVYSMVKDLGIVQPSNYQTILLVSNGEIVRKEISNKIDEYAKPLIVGDKEIGQYCENITSVGECLTIRSKAVLSNIDDPKEKEIVARSSDWANAFLTSLGGVQDLKDLSVKMEYKNCEGDFSLNWNGLGFKTLLEIMMQKYPTSENQLPIDDKIYLQKEVDSISGWRNEGKVIITTTDDSTYEADHVIVTPSVGVLKANHETLFNPSLPVEKVDAIENIGFGAIMKIVMHFSERWWKDDASWHFIWTEDDKKKLEEKKLEWLITISGINQPENNNPNVLIGWYAGSYIPFIETLSDEQILEGQKHVINKFLAPHFNVTMPDKILKTTWYSNPHFRGTNSYDSVQGHSTGGSKFHDKLATPLFNEHNNPTVLFAGEATHPHYFSTVHGAIETGYREAQRLIDLYKE